MAVASLILLLLYWQWRPIPGVVWEVDNWPGRSLLLLFYFLGWAIVLYSSFVIDHFELFGLHQVTNNLTGKAMPEPKFRTPFLYRFVRHPLYFGFILAFWATPTMTIGHLLFAAGTTAYILIGTLLEERDLVSVFGEDYRHYQDRVSMLIPWRKSA